MGSTASEARSAQSPPGVGEEGKIRADGARSAEGKAVKNLNDQPTIVSNRPPISSPSASDPALRILEGRVMPGDRLEHFELIEYVGGGGMGRVFRAIDTRLGRMVALKILSPEQAADPDTLQRFQNEAQSAARLDHDNIARAYYVGEDRGLHYIAFEFVEGVNVRRLVEQRGPLPLADVISYTIQVADALAHADARSVVHRDIKPSNMLITAEGRVKLIDMGLARMRHVDSGAGDLTASGVTLGTFDYISPEQARDPRNADIRSDIYSLGCTVFFMLVGHPPFPDGTVLQKLLQHQGDQPPDVRQFRPELPEGASRILRKMMAKDPRQRYANAADLVADLLVLAEQTGLRPMSPTSRIWLTPQEPMVSFFSRHLPWMAPVAVFVGMVVLLDLFWSWPERRDEPRPAPTIARKESAPASATSSSPARSRTGAHEKSAGDGTAGEPAMGKSEPKTLSALPSAEVPEPTAPASELAPSEDGDGSSQQPMTEQTTEAAQGPEPGHTVMPAPAGNVPSSGVAMPADGPAPPTAVPAHTAVAAAESTPSSPADAPAKRSGLLVVSDSAGGENVFSSLDAACAAAHNGDVIELQFDGPRPQRPIKISNLRLTIRGGEKFHPVLVFRPSEGNPVTHRRSMFTLAAGRLTFSNLAIELHVPRDVPADNWSLLETLRGQTVRLERCWLTILNASEQLAAYHENVAFIRARSSPDAEAAVGGAPAATPLATIELTDCVARGEAVFLQVEDLQPVQLLWDNGLLATTEQLLSAAGGPVAPKLDDMLRLELRHVTAAVRGGLCRLSSTPSNPYQLTTQLICTDSILLAAPGVPLIEQEGAAGVENFRQRLIWSGNRNYYQDVDIFWMVRSADPETPPEVMTFDAWKTYWGESRENQPSTERLAWKKPLEAGRPSHAQTPVDYTLEEPPSEEAGTPGVRADRLPLFPIEPPSDKPARPASLRDAATPRRDAKG